MILAREMQTLSLSKKNRDFDRDSMRISVSLILKYEILVELNFDTLSRMK